MAIYHFSAKMISRANGSSALAAAAYRSASRLHDARLGRHHDFSNKAGVVHSEVLLPEGAPEHLADCERLWNDVEAAELRKDAQLARELDQAEAIRLARDFVAAEFVSRGMVADLNPHWDIGADGEAKPHAHVMLTTREVGEEGFGAKVRDWNRTELLTRWREAWADHVNTRLAELDIDARVDHRSLAAQGIELEPQHKIGPAGQRRLERGEDAERAADHLRIARENGAKIIVDPSIALDAMTHGQATFTTRDLALFVHRHSADKEQFDRAMAAVKASPELIALGRDGRGNERFTSRAMLETESRLEHATSAMSERGHHEVGAHYRAAALARAEERGLLLSDEQRSALEHLTQAKDLGIVIGYAGTGKSAMLGVAREAWESAGHTFRGAALSGIAAENLESGSGISSRTIASLEHQWAQGRELLTDRDVLVIDEAGMIGTRQMERVLSEAAKRGSKVVLVGDPKQLQAIEAGAAFRGIIERHGGVEITSVRRQREDWQREATRQLATGRTDEAVAAYADRGHVHAAATRDDARRDLIERWDTERSASPDVSRLILTHTHDEVRALNELARERLREAGVLGQEVAIETSRGGRLFAAGDRVMFLKNERELGVKNGTVGTVQSVERARMAVMLDDGRPVTFNVKDYADLDHGYAATIHKAQGVTVDRVHVLATPGLDRHAAYVALSRHRDDVQLHYGEDDFADKGKLVRTLSRERAKDLASDFADPVQAFAERRGIGLRERIADVVRKLTPEPVRELAAAIRAAASPPQRSAEQQAHVDNKAAVVRHARAVDAIFSMQERGLAASSAQTNELTLARRELDSRREHASRDIEAVYKREPALAAEATGGSVRRAVVAMQLEAELRTSPPARVDAFVTRWNQLSRDADQAYARGDYAARKAIRHDMAAMAKSLERDPQLESILARRKQALGIAMETGRTLGAELALSRGLDLGRGRDWGCKVAGRRTAALGELC